MFSLNEMMLNYNNLHNEESLISRNDREMFFGYKAVTYWFTGLSGSGKSSVAKGLEKYFFEMKRPIYVLDSDNLRKGLNQDLDFTETGRKENLRRIAEVAKLFNDAGVSVICAFISPTKASRNNAKKIIGELNFLEIYLSTPLEICEQRDPYGLYKKARKGEIINFTGINSTYEIPENPNLVINTELLNINDCVQKIIALNK